jgi:Membrane-bound serine protease (ClpP class)
MKKLVNALAKYAESKALAHGRNGDVVKSFVTENLDLTSEEAMELGVIDFIAEDVEDLLDKVGGSEVKGKVLPEGLAKEEYNASFVTDILDILGDPTIASILAFGRGLCPYIRSGLSRLWRRDCWVGMPDPGFDRFWLRYKLSCTRFDGSWSDSYHFRAIHA